VSAASGKDAASTWKSDYDVGTAADLLVEALLGAVEPDLSSVLLREGRESEELLAGPSQEVAGLGEAVLQASEDGVVLGTDGVGVELGVDGAEERGDGQVSRLRDLGEEVLDEVGPAALPGFPGKDGGDGRLQAGIGIGDSELDAAQLAGDQRAEEAEPGRSVLAREDVHARDFPVAGLADAGGHDDRDVHSPFALTTSPAAPCHSLSLSLSS
jgi:hypothetical protein